MYSSTLDLDNGSVVKQLTQLGGILPRPTKSAIENKSSEVYDDLVIYACFIQENVTILGNGVLDSGSKQMVAVSEVNKRKFSSLLNRTIRMNEGLSRQERIFIQQFWYALQAS